VLESPETRASIHKQGLTGNEREGRNPRV